MQHTAAAENFRGFGFLSRRHGAWVRLPLLTGGGGGDPFHLGFPNIPGTTQPSLQYPAQMRVPCVCLWIHYACSCKHLNEAPNHFQPFLAVTD